MPLHDDCCAKLFSVRCFLAEYAGMPPDRGNRCSAIGVEESWSATALVEQDTIVAVLALEMRSSPDPISRLSSFTRRHCIAPSPDTLIGGQRQPCQLMTLKLAG